MKIEMLKPGPVDGVQRGEGEVVDTDVPTARKLVSRGWATEPTSTDTGGGSDKDDASKRSKKSGSRKKSGPSRTAEGQGPEHTAEGDGESDGESESESDSDDENGGVADS
jgi:hypothetical protein